ncbi:ADP-ribosylation factor-like protein 13A [Talpa occidentalis]|uniref:ADP-ribosylation factor-like protein 13A n=1 Tax=Talpa occidentalis TaxID=50954 RepID=UPI00188DCAB2|nr:ADP-ribosylation factor-like protein 13A [Talpa occidentalis]
MSERERYMIKRKLEGLLFHGETLLARGTMCGAPTGWTAVAKLLGSFFCRRPAGPTVAAGRDQRLLGLRRGREPCSVIKTLSKKQQRSIIESLRWLLAAIDNKYEELHTPQQQPLTSSISTSKSMKKSGERCSSDSFSARFRRFKGKTHRAGQHSVEAKPLKPILQKEGFRSNKKNISVTFALDELMEEGECSRGKGVSNTVEFCHNQSGGNLPIPAPHAVDDDLFKEPRTKMMVDTWDAEDMLLESPLEESFGSYG